MLRIGLIILSLAVIGVAAKADERGPTTILSGIMYGGPDQNNATCYLFNAGRRPVTVRSAAILANKTAATLDFNTCASPVAAGDSCVIQVGAGPTHAIANNTPYACEFVVSGGPVSGEFELRATGDQANIQTFKVIGRIPLTVN